jgi:hypothetical protein
MAKRGRSSSVSLSDVSAEALQKELARRQGRVAAMVRERDALLAKAAKLDGEIRMFGGAPAARAARPGRSGRPAKGGRRRGGGTGMGAATRQANPGGLITALGKVLAGKTMGVTEAAEAVQKAGYTTNAENFRTIVNACLIKNKKVFRKVSRGKYTAA